MLTPEDIDRQQFSKQFKGYAVEEVDDFLEELTNDYEVLMLANKKQEDRIKDLRSMKRTYYKVPIIGLQLLLFFSYIGFIFFYLCKLDKEVAFFDIPIKYTKSSISEQTYGISVTGSTGSTTVHFKSDSFPNKEFRAHYYKSLVFTRGFFRAIEKERLPSLGCYLEPSFLHSKEKEVPFFYSEQEKDIFYYLGLISYMKQVHPSEPQHSL